jgi:uncharacterized protein (TIGR00369 family)
MDCSLMTTTPPPPPGFAPTPNFGGFHDFTGPFYHMVVDEKRHLVGMYVQEHHLNTGRNLHGGMYLMLADTAMTCAGQEHAGVFVTTSLSSEFIAAAKGGEWIEADVEVLKAGRRMIYMSCVVRRGRGGTEPLLRASATFFVKQPKT